MRRPSEDPLPAVRGLRVAWSADFGYAALDPEVRRLTAAAAERFASLGAHVESIDPGWDDPREAAATIWQAAFAARLGERFAAEPGWFEPELAGMIEAGRRVSAVELGRAMFARTTFHGQVQRFLDALRPPAHASDARGRMADRGPAQRDRRHAHARHVRPAAVHLPFNLTGHPAASVPCGFTSDGLPAALQIVGRWHADTLVLQAAAGFEQTAPWAARRPSL